MKLSGFTYILACVFTLALSSAVFGANYVVTRSDDRNNPTCPAGDCSLREAVTAANSASSNDSITFAQGISLIVLSDELLVENNGSLEIRGTGANVLRIDGGTGKTAIFWINQATVSISDMTLTGGGHGDFYTGGGAIFVNQGTLWLDRIYARNNRTPGAGGAVYFYGGANHRIRNSTFAVNQATNCGAFYNDGGTLSVVNSTFTANDAVSTGGAFCTDGTTRVRHITVTNNEAELGGGLVFGMGEFSFGNSIIAGNVVTKAYPEMLVDASGVVFAGNNIIGDSPGDAEDTNVPLSYPPWDILNTPPQLGALADNGGPTPTMALLPTSPAINAGNNARAFDPFDNSPILTDQRGYAPRANQGTVDIGAYESGASALAPPRFFDFDGDAKTDISIFRPSAGEWWYLRSSDGSNRAAQFGTSSDKPVPADYTGDGQTDMAFFRPSTGEWFILRSEDGSFYTIPFGTTDDIPVPADFDGDGRADPAVFRPTNHYWYIQRSSGGTTITQFGAYLDQPVVADYDGDRKADLAIYRPSVGEWWIQRSSNSSVYAFQFGVSTDKPVRGDFTGDGRADPAFWRGSTGEWFVLRSEDASFYSVPFGASGDIPVPGDYDGDGRFDTAVFRPSDSTWYIQRSTAGILITTFGAAGDQPIPSVFVP